MAIPLYVPEEYGPTPASSASSSQNQTTSTLNHPENCASFVHQLIVELCSIYQEYSTAAGNSSSPGQPRRPSRDVNNNSIAPDVPAAPTPTPASHRRRRHPAGDTGLLCSPYEMVPLPALMLTTTRSSEEQEAQISQPQTDSQRQRRHSHSEYECKLSLKTSLGSIGFQLRQIADSYTISSSDSDAPEVSVCPHDAIGAPKLEPGPKSTKRTSWCSAFALVSSLLFIGTVTATVAWIRNK